MICRDLIANFKHLVVDRGLLQLSPETETLASTIFALSLYLLALGVMHSPRIPTALLKPVNMSQLCALTAKAGGTPWPSFP